jgi:hypothetical protein
MKRDIFKKSKPRFEVSSTYVRKHLAGLLQLTEELRVGYETYPRLQAIVAREAWEQLSDVPYQQLLELNLSPRDRRLRDAAAKNILRLEDLVASLLVRDRIGLNDTVTRVLRYRLENGLATQ